MNASQDYLHSISWLDIYGKLNTEQKNIRLLIVQPGARRDPIICSLKCVSLSQDPLPVYETISYFWGDGTKTGSIHISGQSLDVPVSAEAALRRMRYADRERVLWIDAVCINQGDTDERSAQIALMAEIYSKTLCNLIWLGEDDDGSSEQALHAISAVLEDMKAETDNYQNLTRKIYANRGNFLLSASGISTTVDWPALLHYYGSPWFTRLWVVQEASLPQHSTCYRGSTEVPLADLLKAACWMVHKYDSLGDLEPFEGVTCASVIFMYADHDHGRHEILYNRGLEAATLPLLMASLRNFDASQPRDIVYGMLGLYQKYLNPKAIPGALVPNYQDPLGLIFRNVARLVIEENCKLEILYDVRRRWNDCDTGIPSWVPQWQRKFDSSLDHKEVDATRFCADAGEKLLMSDIKMAKDPDVLITRGIVIGLVSVMTTVSRQHVVNNGIETLKDFLITVHNMVVADGNVEQMIAHTLIGGLDGYGVQISESTSAELYTAFYLTVVEEDKFPELLSSITATTPEGRRRAANYYQALVNASFGRSVFVTVAGRMGSGPLLMQEGDIITVLFGSDFPVVLRMIDRRSDTYELIGYCYMYGIMRGEAVHAHRSEGKADAVFNLR